MLNMQISERDKILRVMQESDIDFRLTGSRYFRMENGDSDYDFFTTDSVTTRKWLADNGFKNILKRYPSYQDQQITVVCTHPCGIDVQLVKDIELKSIAQDIIKLMHLESQINKENYYALRVATWNDAYKTARVITQFVLMKYVAR